MIWFAVLTLVWLVVAVFGLQARQRGSARVARRWTTRLYAVTCVPLTALVVGGALVAVQLTFSQAGTGEAITAATPYAQWLAIAINLVIVDIVIRRRDVTPRASGRLGAQVHESFTFGSASSPRP
ncbi:hypothetical protein ACOCJ7_12215 [Knoellia sp. CPCC 206453]|uniref:hypothetical protein n=1 Tax=Knoellia pratensis TaxID=3404796 RepID=UPI003623424C